MYHCWLLKPELFTTVERWVGVETQGKYTQGMTVVDYYFLSGNKPNATVMVDVDRRVCRFAGRTAEVLRLIHAGCR